MKLYEYAVVLDEKRDLAQKAVAAQQGTWADPFHAGNAFSIGYSPTITWQDTSSAATYTPAANILNN